ncbi:MAG: TonB-dependent receptor [Gammaproteobacteria bacterium]|nr:TonB-dependent receptor [Gammaproteobacteria bacterium]
MRKTLLIVSILALPGRLLAFEAVPLIQVYPDNLKLDTTQKTVDSVNTQTQLKIISSDQIAKSGNSNLSDLLSNQDGVQVIQPSSSSYRPIFSIRGFGDNALTNTAILINGQPYFNPDIGAPLFNVIPLSEIGQIEISPSSNSVLYGDQAVGGVINIITKKPTKKQAQASFSYGSFAARKTRFLLGDVMDNGFGYQLSGSILDTNNYRQHNKERLNNIFMSLFYKDAYFRYNKTNHHLQLPGELNFSQASKNPKQAENSIAYNNQDYDIFQLGYKHNLGENWQGEIDSSLHLMTGAGAYEFSNQSAPFNESRKTFTLQPKVSGILNLKKFSVLPTIGWESYYGEYRYSDSEARQNQHAIYGYFEAPVTSKFTTSFGSRYAKAFYKITGGSQDPRNHALVNELGASYQPTNNWRLFAKLAESYRFPKTDEIMFTANQNPLKSQTGLSYETGINYKNSNFSTTLSLYQLDLKDEILFVPDSGARFGGYNKNLDPTQRLGATASLSITPIQYLQIDSSYSFIKGRFSSGSFNGNEIPYVARNNLRITTKLIPSKSFQILFEGIYTGSRYPINDIKNITSKIGGTTIYNCGLSYDQKHYTISIRANNLANKLYYGYVVTQYQGSGYTNGYYPATGLNLTANLNLKL